jgi:hypothetical protein
MPPPNLDGPKEEDIFYTNFTPKGKRFPAPDGGSWRGDAISPRNMAVLMMLRRTAMQFRGCP